MAYTCALDSVELKSLVCSNFVKCLGEFSPMENNVSLLCSIVVCFWSGIVHSYGVCSQIVLLYGLFSNSTTGEKSLEYNN